MTSPSESSPAEGAAAAGTSAERTTAPEIAVRGPNPRPGGFAMFLALVFGVVTPVLAVAVESADSLCADAFFDPLPTAVHTVLYLLVAASNLACWSAVVRERPLPSFVAGPLWGVAFGVAIWYSLAFAVLVPVSVLAIAVVGLGFLSLSPLTALWTAWRLRDPAHARGRGALAGAFAGVALLCAADLPAATAHVAIVRASSSDEVRAASARSFLRTSVPASAVLAAADRPPSVMSPLGAIARFGWRWDDAAAADAAWRVTGEVPRRDGFRRRLLWNDDFDDDERGTGTRTVVGPEVRGLCLDSSRVAGTVLAGAGVADLAWEMTFRNTAPFQAEARAVVVLPEGGVVSDATLWVAGQPRDAVFASRAKARQVYEQIVNTRRDPLLVSSDGPGRALVQCFPVPPDGTMQIRLRIAAPLADRDGADALELPRISARNFAVCDGAVHEADVSVEGTIASLPPGHAARLGDDRFNLVRAAGHAADFVEAGGAIVLVRGMAEASVTALDPFEPGAAIFASRAERVVEPPSRLVVVVDTSGAAASAGGREAAASLLRAVPDGTEVAVFAASDRVVDATNGVVRLSDDVRGRVGSALAALPWQGGVDSLPALRTGAAAARMTPDARLVWLHGPQARLPHRRDGDLGDVEAPGRLRPVPPVALSGIRIAPGTNLIAESRDLVPNYEEEPSSGPAVERAAAAAGRWFSRPTAWTLALDRRADPPPGAVRAPKEAARPLAALWAAREATRLAADGSFDDGARLAARHRVVTPMTSALVLETDEQVRRAGLDQVEPGSLPTVPEPGEWAVLALLAAAAVFAWRRGRTSRTHQLCAARSSVDNGRELVSS